MTQQNNKKNPNEGFKIISIFRIFLVIFIISTVTVYTWAVITGHVSENRKIDMVNLAVIAFAVVTSLIILNPRIFNRLKMFQVSSFKLEMLERVKEKQAEQETRLDDITLILPLLIPKTERKHLLNIAEGKTSDYKGSHSLRSELRSLRSAGLIKSKPQTTIGQLKNDSIMDISNLLELTALGNHWIKRIKEFELIDSNNLK